MEVVALLGMMPAEHVVDQVVASTVGEGANVDRHSPITTEVAMPDVIAEDGRDRQHRLRLRHLLESTSDPVRIVSPYVTDRELLLGSQEREIRLVTSLFPMD